MTCSGQKLLNWNRQLPSLKLLISTSAASCFPFALPLMLYRVFTASIRKSAKVSRTPGVSFKTGPALALGRILCNTSPCQFDHLPTSLLAALPGAKWALVRVRPRCGAARCRCPGCPHPCAATSPVPRKFPPLNSRRTRRLRPIGGSSSARSRRRPSCRDR